MRKKILLCDAYVSKKFTGKRLWAGGLIFLFWFCNMMRRISPARMASFLHLPYANLNLQFVWFPMSGDYCDAM